MSRLRGILAKDDQSKPPESPGVGRGGRFAALSALAGRVLLVERAWPPLVWALAVAALFLALSWFGVWFVAPRLMRIGGVVLFALALLAALAPLVLGAPLTGPTILPSSIMRMPARPSIGDLMWV